MTADFSEALLPAASQAAESGIKRSVDGVQKERVFLRAYETLPAQLLNVYGRASYVQVDEKRMWQHLNRPQKTGARYMMELAASDAERRGVGLNRYLQILVDFCQYQTMPEIKAQNQVIMKEAMYLQLNAEVDEMLPVFKALLAPRKARESSGASALRTGIKSDQPASKYSDQTALKQHAERLYRWIKQQQSRIRMLMTWQACGGLSFVVSVHQKAVQCFVQYGNSEHEGLDTAVSLQEFQDAVVSRHDVVPVSEPHGPRLYQNDFTEATAGAAS